MIDQMITGYQGGNSNKKGTLRVYICVFVSPKEKVHTFHTQGREGERGVFIITKVGVVATAEVFTPRPSIPFSSSLLVFIT